MTGRMRNRIDAGKEGYRKEELQERRDAGADAGQAYAQDRRKQERRDAGRWDSGGLTA